MKEDKHLKFTVFDDYVIIYLREALKSDEGKYKLIVKNESGQAEGNFMLRITGNLYNLAIFLIIYINIFLNVYNLYALLRHFLYLSIF